MLGGSVTEQPWIKRMILLAIYLVNRINSPFSLETADAFIGAR